MNISGISVTICHINLIGMKEELCWVKKKIALKGFVLWFMVNL